MSKPARRRWTLLLTVIATLLISVPAAVWASHQFTDVPDSHTFHNAIGWMKDNNITVGCNPPANTQYCPNDNVTRGQMAAFMKRLAENQVVDADTVDGQHAADLVSPIVLSSPPADWIADSAIGTVTHHSNRAEFIGGPTYLGLPTPSMVGNADYGLDSLEICYQASPGSSIGATHIIRNHADGLGTQVLTDLTTRSSTTFQCYTIDADLLPGKGLTVSLQGGGPVSLGSVTATWTTDIGGFD